ncbi:MAG: CdaR family protein [Treponema sp.]
MKNYNENKIIRNFIEGITHNWLPKVICIMLAIIIVQIYNASLLEKRYFSVHLKYEYSEDLISASVLPTTVRVSVWGNSSIINSIRDEDIIAYVDTHPFTVEGEYKVPVSLRKNNSILNEESLELQAEPSEIKIKLENKIFKTVDVKLAVTGEPHENYAITETPIEPTKVNIVGPRSSIDKIETLTTEFVQIDNRSSDVSGYVNLINPNPLVSVMGSAKIQYTIKISEMEITRAYRDVNIFITNLNENLTITNILPKGEIVVSGSKEALNNWIKGPNVLYIDCKNITSEAEWVVDVQHLIPNKLKLVSIEPKKVSINIKQKEIQEESVE